MLRTGKVSVLLSTGSTGLRKWGAAAAAGLISAALLLMPGQSASAAPARVLIGPCPSGKVCLYDFTGYSVEILQTVGNYNNFAIGSSANDRAESVINNTNSTVRLYADAYYESSKVCIGANSSISTLGSFSMANRASSLQSNSTPCGG